jgi:hypothetical protein
MPDSRIAMWLTAVSATAAAVSFGLALYQHNDKERKEEVAKWQRVILYKIVSDGGGPTFRDLKLRYVAEAQQLQSFKLPGKEIQDDALRLNLLDLQRDRLISLSLDGAYRPVVDVPNQQDLVMALVKTEASRKDVFYIQRPIILRMIEGHSGQYTTEELFQKVRDNKIKLNEEDFYNIISNLRVERFINRDSSGRLWSTYDIDSPAPVSPRKKK